MVALEAWALGKPVLANGRCDVLRGQCVRSNGGLYYETFEEFAEALYALEATGPLGAILGRNGREFFRRHYTWPVIERKYLEMFDRLKREPSARRRSMPLPGFFARRRRDLPPAAAGRRRAAGRPGGEVDGAPRPSDARDARLRRRHRPRGARHPARAARRRLRLRDHRRDRRPAARRSRPSTTATWSTRSRTTTC